MKIDLTRVVLLLILLFPSLVGQSQQPRQNTVSCPAHIDLEITRQAGQTVYRLQQKSTSKYPLDMVGTLANRCPQIKGMYIVADSSVPFDDILTALNGSGKNQIDPVAVFIRKNGFFIPLTVGDQSTKDPAK
ncbi:MAG TPA: hypothetical protein VGT04_10670 [Acidobacteriaceae bacterium]|nr:hypothetical protein [Acidobacteriaceae bacterium]